MSIFSKKQNREFIIIDDCDAENSSEAFKYLTNHDSILNIFCFTAGIAVGICLISIWFIYGNN